MKHRGKFLLFIILGSLAALAGTPFLGLNLAPQRTFEGENEDFAYLERIQDVFGRDDNIMLVHVRSDKLFSKSSITFLRNLHKSLAEVDGVFDVQDLTTAWIIREGDSRPSLLLKSSENNLEWVQKRALSEPLISGHFISNNGRSALMFVRFDPDRMQFRQLMPIVEECLSTIDRMRPPEDVEVMATGLPVARILIGKRIVIDQLTFFPLCAVLFMIILFVIFRDFRAVFIPLIAVVISLAFILGAMGALGQDINVVNCILPILIFVIGVSDSVHITVRYRNEYEARANKSEAILISFRHLLVACFLTSITTSIGFASLLSAQISVLKHFGLQAAFGILVAFLTTILFVPLAFSFVKPVKISPKSSLKSRIDRICERIARFSTRYRFAVLAVTLLLVGGSVLFAKAGKRETHIYEAFRQDDPIVLANNRLEEDFRGVIPVSIVFEWSRPSRDLTPEHFEYIQEIQRSLEADQVFGETFSVVDLMREWNVVHHQGDQTKRTIPDTTERCRQALDETRTALTFSGRRFILDRVYAPGQKMLRITTTSKRVGSQRYSETLDRIEARIEGDSARQEALGLRLRLTGDGPVAAWGIAHLIDDLMMSFFLAFGVIFIALCVVFRSFLVGIICIIPNVLPLILTLGFMGVLGIDLQVNTVIVFAISLGLAVDDTIHFIVRFKEERAKPGGSFEEDIIQAARGTGSAIFTTSLMLFGGMSVLFLSQFPYTIDFALCIEFTIIAALVSDLIVLPAFLRIFQGVKALSRVPESRSDLPKQRNC